MKRTKHIKKPHKRIQKTYIPQELRLTRPSNPYASKYGDECYIKVQAVRELTTDALGNVFLCMRQDLAASTATNIVPFD